VGIIGVIIGIPIPIIPMPMGPIMPIPNGENMVRVVVVVVMIVAAGQG